MYQLATRTQNDYQSKLRSFDAVPVPKRVFVLLAAMLVERSRPCLDDDEAADGKYMPAIYERL